MTFRDANGNVLSKTEFLAKTTTVAAPETQYKLTEKIMESFSLSGESEANFEAASRQRYKAGTVLTQSQVDALFPTGGVTAISPATGAAVGLNTVTITGTDLSGVETVTFGGTAATEIKVKSKTKITCKVPAHAAGAVTVVVGDDSGNITKPNFYTYT